MMGWVQKSLWEIKIKHTFCTTGDMQLRFIHGSLSCSETFLKKRLKIICKGGWSCWCPSAHTDFDLGKRESLANIQRLPYTLLTSIVLLLGTLQQRDTAARGPWHYSSTQDSHNIHKSLLHVSDTSTKCPAVQYVTDTHLCCVGTYIRMCTALYHMLYRTHV